MPDAPSQFWTHDRRAASALRMVRTFDAAVDRTVARVRSDRLDPLFYGLSSAADHSALWFACGAAVAAARRDRRFLTAFVATMAAESALTNGAIKAAFRRVRPPDERDGPLPYGMRRPITSSFPSGHATAAFTAAMLLSSNRRTAAFWFPLAGLVASSRVYVGMHHGSDVVAGAALGLGFGTIGRRVLRRIPPA